MEKFKMICITIFQEFVPDRLIIETKKILTLLDKYSKKIKSFFSNTKIKIYMMDIEKIDENQIKQEIFNNKIKFSKSINSWPSIILNIEIENVEKIISIENQKEIFYEISINSHNIPNSIFEFILKQFNVTKKNNKFYVSTKYEIKGNIFVSIVSKTINDKISDIEYFIKQDMSINNFEERLSQIQYFKNSGSILDKSKRLEKIALRTYSEISHAAKYCKYDLCTSMVREYPELQGTIGSIYFEDNTICEQYFHKIEQFKTINGMKLALIDNLDKICSIFDSFTSSRDPFGLKRATQLSIRIMIYMGKSIDIKNICKICNADYKKVVEIIIKQMKVLYANLKHIITDDISKNIENILFYMNHKNQIETLKLIYKRLKSITKCREESIEIFDLSNIENKIVKIAKNDIMQLEMNHIDEWMKNTYVKGTEREKIAGFILYKIEFSLNIHLVSS